ncbi:precorrin-2 dehydrogenase / sirohydrochlorin ferrochelatase [Selenomonas ruminantium]|uniref:precorrin-2 dehydrogenase n=1 Tax=Selenomonas ruminantium TaxID=971 RepID=A0A1M6V1J4_SELRU|nr:bifunctional precorrin-2 dehydrogenase/sirohydrochlorin ferrochelatase [Selenomonas ruminantium]SHK75362.1 precorrin-2 dehydrogenase / sirohydrochlorin ferrochelatase [Selenomonas ruminantium]
MVLYPLNLNLAGKACVVIGGGQVAGRKVRDLLAAGARVTVIAPALTEGLQKLVAAGQVVWQNSVFHPGMLLPLRPLLVFVTSSDKEANHLAIAEAKEMGALVNAAAAPEQTDFSVPSKVARGDFLLTISTGGGSPAFAKLLRERLENEYPDCFGEFLARLNVLRQEVKGRPGGSREHERLWRQALTQDVIDLVRAGHLDQAEEEVRNGIIDAGIEPQDGTR